MSTTDSTTSCDTCGRDVPSKTAVWSRNKENVHCGDTCLRAYEKIHPGPAYEPEQMPIPPSSVQKMRISVFAQYVSSLFS